MHGRHAGHDLERDARRSQCLGLLAAAAKHEGIAALEPHHTFAFAGLGQQQSIQFGLGDTVRPVVFATVDDLRSRRGEAQ